MTDTLISSPRSEAEAIVARAIELFRAKQIDDALALLGEAEAAEGAAAPLVAHVAGLAGYFLHRRGALAEAKKRFEAAELLWEALPDDEAPSRLSAFLNNYANLLCDLDRPAEARFRLEALLESDRRQHGDEHTETARTRANLARVLIRLGMAALAVPQAERAAETLRKAPDEGGRHDAIGAANILGIAYLGIDAPDKALSVWEELLAADGGDRTGWASDVLNNIGTACFALGDYEKALASQERALSERRAYVGDHPDAEGAQLRTNIGAALHRLGRFAEAAQQYEAALAELSAVYPSGVQRQFISVHENLGASFYRLERLDEAERQYSRALALAEEIHRTRNHPDATNCLYHLAELAWMRGSSEEALNLCVDLLGLGALQLSPEQRWRAFSLLGQLVTSLGDPHLGVLLSKEAVNLVQETRRRLAHRGPAAETQFIAGRDPAYRTLAGMLIEEDRIAEAQQVMTMLRAGEQLNLFARDTMTPLHAEALGCGYLETKLRVGYLASFRRIETMLEELRRPPEAGQDHAEGERNQQRLKEELYESAASLRNDLRTLLDRAPPPRTAHRVRKASEAGLEPGVALGPGETMLQYVMNGPQVYGIRNDSDGRMERVAIASDSSSIKQLVFDLRVALVQPQSSIDTVHTISRKLYDLLLRPLLDNDTSPQPGRLRFWLDGSLRYLPPGVFHDGRGYLVERFPIYLHSVVTHGRSARKLGLSDQVAGFAVGPQIFPHAAWEVRSIVRDGKDGGLFRGRRFIGEDFSASTLESVLSGGAGALHVASHFFLNPANLAQSGVLSGDGRLIPVAQLGRLDYTNTPIVILSGCQTATAGIDGEEAYLQSFADRVLQCGARLVIASLWPVSDLAGARLMVAFYQALARDPGLDFAGALRQAQLALMVGEADCSDERGFGGESSKTGLSCHPYHWSPFVLLGDADRGGLLIDGAG